VGATDAAAFVTVAVACGSVEETAPLVTEAVCDVAALTGAAS
jgi:hypothetical protein